MTQVTSGPPRQRRMMLRSKKHREFVSAHLCVVCQRGLFSSQHGVGSSQGCHVNYLGAKHGRPRGKGEKVDDVWVIPMCPHDHDHQSRYGQSGTAEIEWWINAGIDPEPICLELARNSPDPKVREFADAL